MVSTSINQIDELDLFSLPLTGRVLIEASAGTGKTYSLAFIYLRLLLGIGENGFHRPLLVDEILVVTFTQSATEELRYRIRQNIVQLLNACQNADHVEPDYQALLVLIDNKQVAIEQLMLAEQSMDEAAIFTIHGFCQRMLMQYAFEAGLLFDQRLAKDESSLYLQITQDFWRNTFSPLPIQLAKAIRDYWVDPETLLREIRPYLGQTLPQNIEPSNLSIVDKITQFHQQAIQQIDLVKQHWLQTVDQLELLINESGVKKQSYSKRNLPNWLNSVTTWAKQETTNYQLVAQLSNFSQSVLNEKTPEDKKAPVHAVFAEIETLLSTSFKLNQHILFDIVIAINQKIAEQKLQLAQMGFDDLLRFLNEALSTEHNSHLAHLIAHQYPVAMIDEFQDTDPVQYQIFNQIYQQRQQTGLLLIGDPKQAIYGFRGADIFTYIQAKQDVDYWFTMSTNWRSSQGMVEAVNSLFELRKHPFVFDSIPFIHMATAEKNTHKQFVVNNQAVNALNCYILPENITSKEEYNHVSADYCAEQIAQWLSQDCYFVDDLNITENQRKKVVSADIAILVRSSREAGIMQEKLKLRGIKSVYASNHSSVFDTLEARELLRILQAVLTPTNDNDLRSALATQLIGASMSEIAVLSDDQNQWETLVEEFNEYKQLWLRFGVLAMLRRLMNHRQLIANLLSLDNGERIVTNLMHLGELLQKASQEFDSPNVLVRWFAKQIDTTDFNLEDYELRLESDENLVHIITIHKSKGLEYPIVCLPFIGQFRDDNKRSIYHDRNDYQLYYASKLTEQISDWIEEERLAEDLRLLYVAITRSIYHCQIGLAGLKNSAKSSALSLGKSAIGYLLANSLENEQPFDYSQLIYHVQRLAHTSIDLITQPITLTELPNSTLPAQTLFANTFKRQLNYSWRVTSYSGLLQNAHNDFIDEQLADLGMLDIEVLNDSNNQAENAANFVELESAYSIYQFPKGAMVGTLLHECFEKMDFQQPISPDLINNVVTKLNLEAHWQKVLADWFAEIVTVPLNQQGLTLSNIPQHKRLDELQFYLPVKHKISATQLDQLCKKHDAISQHCPTLSFYDVQGMLKGFIDLVFEWNGKYYIIDYKSNYLGDNIKAYSQDAMIQAMIEHRYDLQYQLYSLALHRYLKNRLSHYQYETHFGGVFYLFVRGMTSSAQNNGVFYHQPTAQFINELDQLFG